jgi:chloramphenicol O-acetyltransferase type A
MGMSEGKYTKIDLEKWERIHQYDFFSTYQWPFFQVTAPVNISKLHARSKENKESLFLHYFHAALTVMNDIPNFKIRFAENELREYHTIHGGCTVARDNGTFGFGFFPFLANRHDFIKQATPILENVKSENQLKGLETRNDVAFFSVLPWMSFTSFSNPHRTFERDAFPRIVFGKYTPTYDGNIELPVSVEVHHALADGIHVGRFFQKFQALLNAD